VEEKMKVYLISGGNMSIVFNDWVTARNHLVSKSFSYANAMVGQCGYPVCEMFVNSSFARAYIDEVDLSNNTHLIALYIYLKTPRNK
jgi:hypothetical protein